MKIIKLSLIIFSFFVQPVQAQQQIPEDWDLQMDLFDDKGKIKTKKKEDSFYTEKKISSDELDKINFKCVLSFNSLTIILSMDLKKCTSHNLCFD